MRAARKKNLSMPKSWTASDTVLPEDRPLRAKHKLNILVVGAGIAGLTIAIGLKLSGHKVTVLEKVATIKDVGAGIQIAPNSARIFRRFGLLERMLKLGIILSGNSIRKFDTNEECSHAPFDPYEYGAPLFVMHRGDLQRILLDAAREAHVKVRLSAPVAAVDDDFQARLWLESGEVLEGDLVLAADGIKSRIRTLVAEKHGVENKSWSSGDAVYRLMVPLEAMKGDEEALKDYMQEDVGMRWMGPGSHLMSYPVRNNTVYNMVLVHPENPTRVNRQSWTTSGDKKELLEDYKHWHPTIRKLLSYAPEGEIMEWSLMLQNDLPKWYENRVALIGDACHAMLPYLAQGASQAIEDTGVLVTALALAPSVPIALEVYSLIRKPRMETMHELVATTQKNLHLEGDEDLLRRDEEMKALEALAQRESIIKHPDRWADKDCQDFMYGVDVMKQCVEQWNELSNLAKKDLKGTSDVEYSDLGFDGVQDKREKVKKESMAQVEPSRKRARSPEKVTLLSEEPPCRPKKKRMVRLKLRGLTMESALAKTVDLDRAATRSVKIARPR